VAAERTIRVWEWVAGAHDGRGPVPIAAVGRAAVRWLGVDGASVTALSGPLAREPLFASDALSARLEELQFTLGEGPGADGFRLGAPELVPDLDRAAGRWTGFAPAAVAAGARAMFAVPLAAGAIRVGVLSLYRARPGPLPAPELADALVLAGIALQIVLDDAAGISGLPGYQPLNGLPYSRAEVYQAIGMISVQLGVSLEEASVRLRASAFVTGADLGELAEDIVSRRRRFEPDPAPEPEPLG